MNPGLTFLDVAELILRDHGSALSSDDIVRLALERNELRTHGATPETAMRARLSVDIRDGQDSSRFQRIGPNRFALRRWRLEEYVVPSMPRQEYVACIDQGDIDLHGRFFGYLSMPDEFASHLADRRRLRFVERVEAEARDDIKQIICYVLLEHDDGRVLTYRRGAYSTSAKFLKGSYCIGFGGHVDEEDVQSLFGYRDGGIVACALREVGEELKGLYPRNLELIGAINDDSSPNGLRHFAFVFRARLPSTFVLERQKHEWGVGELSLLPSRELWRRYHDLEFWSQLLVKNLLEPPDDLDGVYFSQRRALRSRGPIVLVGEIASGKTEVARYLQEAHQFSAISTRDCVASLIHATDFGTGDRSSFQEKAASLVATERGLDELAVAIEHKIAALDKRLVIVDGVRNIGTLERLRRVFPQTLLLYVEAPRDRSFEFFCARKGQPQSVDMMSEFRRSRHHPVEREVSLIKYRANRYNSYLFNNGSRSDLHRKLDMWASELVRG